MADLSALIERLDALTGPDREVDADIFQWFGGKDWDYAYLKVQEPCGCPHEMAVDYAGTRYSPKYTASIDAAVALVERVLPGYGLSVETQPVYGGWWDAAIFNRMPMTIANARKQTAALAVCLATLRALQAREGWNG